MKKIIVLKETNYQKWLDSYRVHLTSKNIIIGKLYDGCVIIDKEKISSNCRTIYFDFSKKVILAEDITDKKFLFLSGLMYDYQNIIYAGECNIIKWSQPLKVFVEESIAKSGCKRTNLNKKTLVNILVARFHPKIVGLYEGSLEVIANAYLGGWIK